MDEAKIESTASKVSPNDPQVSAALVFSSAGAKVKLESDGVEIKGEADDAEFAVEPESIAERQTPCASPLGRPICRPALEAVDIQAGSVADERESGENLTKGNQTGDAYCPDGRFPANPSGSCCPKLNSF